MISFYDVDGRMGLKNVWDLLNWDKHRQIVSRIQTRIVKAVRSGLKQTVRSLQRLLSNSLSAKLIAIKRVISNSGKRTPGVDNILIDTPRKRWDTLKNLNLPEYKAKPLKRIYIPKKNGKKRPLGIQRLEQRSIHTILHGGTISKPVGNKDNCRVWQHALSMLEPDEVKVSRPVLRGLGAGNSPRLPGDKPQMFGVKK